jgi:GSCFA family
MMCRGKNHNFEDMDFRTELSLKPSALKIDLKDPILTIGSCFADSIGQELIDNKFKAIVNPFGTTYHPLSIHKILKYAAYQEYPTGNTFLVNDGIHFNYDFHSDLNGSSQSELAGRLREHIASVHYYLKTCKVLILTYGTSWIFERIDTGEAVANCHKMPGTLFTKRLAGVDEIKNSFEELYNILKSINKNITIILTVSPVRHIKDTLVLNNVSKSILRIASHLVSAENPDVDYFPAFEIMMDDLRDYRFYKSDLIHPTDMAEEYIWGKFSSVYFDKEVIGLLEQFDEIRKALAHLPFHQSSDSHQKFLRKTLIRLEELKSRMNVEEEIKVLKSQLV